MRIIVTGAAGFIGSNIVAGLNRRGIDDVIVVDDLTEGTKVSNLVDLQIADYVDRADFYTRFAAGAFGRVDAVFHEGACSDTMEHDGRYMMATNYETSRTLLDSCAAQGTRLLYASSAATYGGSSRFVEEPANERPLNVYGFSKLLFDNVVRRRLTGLPIQVAGFRYFNVYGPREAHKGRMASVAFHHARQLRETGRVALFGAHGGYDAGEQRRDFIHVDDVVAVKLWFLDHPDRRGIFNLGTGRAQPFNNIAQAAINAWRHVAAMPPLPLAAQIDRGLLTYTDFPDALKGRYQSFTQADLTALHAAGCVHQFRTVQDGVADYVARLLADSASFGDVAR